MGHLAANNSARVVCCACVEHFDPEVRVAEVVVVRVVYFSTVLLNKELVVKMSRKGAAKPRMESVRLKINEHMTSLGEEILCVLDEQQRCADVCSVTLNFRVFVLERLSAAALFVCDLFQREMEPLETLLETQSKLLDIDFDMDLDPNTAG